MGIVHAVPRRVTWHVRLLLLPVSSFRPSALSEKGRQGDNGTRMVGKGVRGDWGFEKISDRFTNSVTPLEWAVCVADEKRARFGRVNVGCVILLRGRQHC